MSKGLTSKDIQEIRAQLNLIARKLNLPEERVSAMSTAPLRKPTSHEKGARTNEMRAHEAVIIPTAVNGHVYDGLFDTGSSISLAPLNLAKTLHLELNGTDRFVKTVSGQIMMSTQKARVQLSIAGHTREVDLHFVDGNVGHGDSYEFVIGVDAMKAFPAYGLDVNKRQLTMGRHIVDWGNGQLRNAVCTEDTRTVQLSRHNHDKPDGGAAARWHG
jgi:hypothetical protein